MFSAYPLTEYRGTALDDERSLAQQLGIAAVANQDQFRKDRVAGRVHQTPRGLGYDVAWQYVAGNSALKRALIEKANIATRLGWEIVAVDGVASPDEDQRTMLRGYLRSRRRCPPSGLSAALWLAAIELEIFGRGIFEVPPPVSKAAEVMIPGVGRRAVAAGFQRIPRTMCAQEYPRPKKRAGWWWGRGVEYDRLDVMFPRMRYRYRAPHGETITQYLKAFGDSRLIDRHTGDVTTDWSRAASEYLTLDTYHPDNPEGEPDWMSAFSEVETVRENKEMILHHHRESCVPSYFILFQGYNPLKDETGLSMLEAAKTAIRKVRQRRKNENEHTSGVVLSIDGAGNKIEIHEMNPIGEGHKILLDYRERDTLDILTAVGVPSAIANYTPRGGLGGAGWAKTQVEQFYTSVRLGLQGQIHDVLDVFILEGLGITDYTVRLKPPRIYNPKEEAEAALTWSKIRGAMLVNEIRERIGRLGSLKDAMTTDGGEYDPGKMIVAGPQETWYSLETIESFAQVGYDTGGTPREGDAAARARSSIEPYRAPGMTDQQLRDSILEVRGLIREEMARRGLDWGRQVPPEVIHG